MSCSIDTDSIKHTDSRYEHFLSFTYDNGFKDDANYSGRCSCELYRYTGNEIRYKVINEKNEEWTRVILQDVLSFESSIKNNLLYLDIELLDKTTLSYCFILPKKRGP